MFLCRRVIYITIRIFALKNFAGTSRRLNIAFETMKFNFRLDQNNDSLISDQNSAPDREPGREVNLAQSDELMQDNLQLPNRGNEQMSADEQNQLQHIYTQRMIAQQQRNHYEQFSQDQIRQYQYQKHGRNSGASEMYDFFSRFYPFPLTRFFFYFIFLNFYF